MKASKPYHTLGNLGKVMGYYGVQEEKLKMLPADIIDKMLEAAHKDELDNLHHLGYHLWTDYEPSPYILKFDFS